MALALLAPGSAAAATTFVVDRTDDGFLVGGCTAAPNDCTLRDAVANANSSPGNTVSIPAGLYKLTVAGSDDADAIGDLDFLGSTTVTGAGAGSTTIQAVGIDRVLDFRAGPSSLSGVTVTGGGTEDGAGINLFAGTLSVANSVITGNTVGSPLGGGGGFFVGLGTTLNLDRSTISGNSSGGAEGGGLHVVGTATITNSAISQNTTGNGSDGGGGIYNDGGTLTLVNTTLSDNTTDDTGGGMVGGGGPSVTVLNSTIASNSAGLRGGGIHVDSGSTQIRNSIVAGNSAPSGSNCFGNVVSQGHNIDSDTGCGFGAAGDLSNADPLLGALADNGGPTQTRALGAGSPAIDAADGSVCPATDQRGIARPQLGGCDIGAFEAVDSDGDGVPDTADACPTVAAQTADGCDTTAPAITLAGKKRQRADGTIEVKVSCDEACTAAGGGKLTVTRPAATRGKAAARVRRRRFRLTSAPLSLAAGQVGILKLKPSKQANRATTAALLHRGHARAKIVVFAADPSGNAGGAARSVRLKPAS